MPIPTIEEMNELILAIRYYYQLNEEEITEKIGYNKTYISQARSRGTVSEKFMKLLGSTFPDASKAKATDSDEHALLAVLVERVAFLLSESSGKSAQIERETIVKDAEELKKLRQS